MSNYPAGAWADPNAPWNELRCPMCGELVVKVLGMWERQECTECDWEYEENVQRVFNAVHDELCSVHDSSGLSFSGRYDIIPVGVDGEHIQE